MAFSLGIYTTPENVEDVLTNYVQKLDPPSSSKRSERMPSAPD